MKNLIQSKHNLNERSNFCRGKISFRGQIKVARVFRTTSISAPPQPERVLLPAARNFFALRHSRYSSPKKWKVERLRESPLYLARNFWKIAAAPPAPSLTFSSVVGGEAEGAVTTFGHERILALLRNYWEDAKETLPAFFLLPAFTHPVCKLFGKCFRASFAFATLLFVAPLYGRFKRVPLALWAGNMLGSYVILVMKLIGFSSKSQC